MPTQKKREKSRRGVGVKEQLVRFRLQLAVM